MKKQLDFNEYNLGKMLYEKSSKSQILTVFIL